MRRGAEAVREVGGGFRGGGGAPGRGDEVVARRAALFGNDPGIAGSDEPEFDRGRDVAERAGRGARLVAGRETRLPPLEKKEGIFSAAGAMDVGASAVSYSVAELGVGDRGRRACAEDGSRRRAAAGAAGGERAIAGRGAGDDDALDLAAGDEPAAGVRPAAARRPPSSRASDRAANCPKR